MSELPRGWASTRIGDVAAARMGKTIIAHELVEHGLPVYSANRDDGPWGFVRESDVVFERGTLVVSARGTIGFVRLPIDDRFVSTQTTIALRPSAGVLPEFLRYALRRVDWAPVTSTTTIPMLTIGQINEIDAPLAPLNEQRRIVEKLDVIFEKSRAAKARLERLPALLDKLKRSILAAAFRGDLTKDWRAAHPDVEPASVLLERIRTERRRRWEEGLRAKGKDPKKATYEEPAPVDTSELPALPEGWAWASVAEVAKFVTDGEHATPNRTESGVPLLSARNVRDGSLDLTKIDFVSPETHAVLCRRLRVEEGDVLLSCSGSVGRSCVVPAGSNFSLVRSVAVIRPWLLDGSYLSLALRSPAMQAQIEQSKTETAQANIFQGRILRLAVPVAPRAEQERLDAAVAEAFARLAAVADRVTSSGGRVATLEHAALAKAFRGELVPQDPTDEPASALLERIRAARADETARPRRGRSAKPAADAKQNAPQRAIGARPEVSEAEPLDVVVGAFHQASRLTASAIGEATGLDAASVKKALKALVDAGQVRVEGKARGTSYVWSG